MAVLVIPMSVGAGSYLRTARMVEENAIEISLSRLEHSASLLSQRVEEIDSTLEQLAGNSDVKRVLSLSDPYKGKNTYQVFTAVKNLPAYKLTNSDIIDYYVFAQTPGLVLTQGVVYFPDEFLDKVGLSSIGSTQRKILFEAYGRKWAAPMQIQVKGLPVRTVAFCKSLGAPNLYRGSVMLFIREEMFQDILKTAADADSGGVFVLDEAGRLVSAYAGGNYRAYLGDEINWVQELPDDAGSQKRMMGNMEMLVTYHISPYNGWKYVSVQPMKSLLEQLDYVRRYTLFFLLCAMGIGVVMSYILAYRSSKPLLTLLKSVSAEPWEASRRRENVYERIQESIDKLASDKNQLAQRLQEQLPYIQTEFLERLLRGSITDPKEIEVLSDHTGLSFSARCCGAAVANFRFYEQTALNQDLFSELEKHKIIFQQIVSQCSAGARVYFHNVDRSRVACLFLLDTSQEEGEAAIERVIAEADKVAAGSGLKLVWGIGSVQEDAAGLSRSFYEANGLADAPQTAVQAKNIFSEREAQGKESSCYYPEELEFKLIAFARGGELDAIKDTCRMLYWENFHNRSLSGGVQTLLLYKMCGTLYKIAAGDNNGTAKAKLEDLLASLQDGMGFDAGFVRVLALYEEICAAAVESNSLYHQRLAQDVTEFIQGNYQDPDLSLAGLAGQFHVSEAYLSQFFKEKVGENFSAYLETLRLAHARELLKNTRKPVKQIAGECGYSSVNSFCRAFKRVMKMNTSEYRSTAAAD